MKQNGYTSSKPPHTLLAIQRVSGNGKTPVSQLALDVALHIFIDPLDIVIGHAPPPEPLHHLGAAETDSAASPRESGSTHALA